MEKRILSRVVTLTKHNVITIGAIDIQINLKMKTIKKLVKTFVFIRFILLHFRLTNNSFCLSVSIFAPVIEKRTCVLLFVRIMN